MSARSPGPTTAADPLPPREAALRRLLDHRQLLRAQPDATLLAGLGSVHADLASALQATRRLLPAGDESWLHLRERCALRVLHHCDLERANRIRFRSHLWSNQLLALSELDHDEDLALLAEDFFIDCRIMLASEAIIAPDIAPNIAPDITQELAADLRLGDLMVTCYQAGGWPCGWVGAYPLGSLQIFARGG